MVNDGNKMQQRKQQLEPKSERAVESQSHDEPESGSGRQKEEGGQHGAEEMNFDDTTYSNTAPRQELYDGIARGWLSPEPSGTSGLSPATAKLFSGYSFLKGTPSVDSGIGTFAEFCSQEGDQGRPATPLTREEQAADTSYTMLASQRSPMSTASVDGRIQEPHLNDILCGRGGSINSHPGNRVFRGWITERRQSYNLADSKADKSRITSEILERVRDQGPPGRFLQKIVDGSKQNDPYNISGYWFEIDDSKALAKISQALREGAPAFRALHGKKGGAKKQSQSKRTSTTRRKKKNDEAHELSPGDKRKEPPSAEPTREGITPEAASPTPLPAGGGHELDVLFPTTDNVFATENYQARCSNLLNSYPLVHMGDYTASIDEVAAAMPSTPVATKKPRASTPPTDEIKTGTCNTPTYPRTPNGNMISPGFSPYGEAKAAWDSIAFMPNLGSNSGSPVQAHQPRLSQRVHSLSFSEGDAQSIGSFNNPFENDNGKDDNRVTPREHPEERPEAEHPRPCGEADGCDATFPPPLPLPWRDPRPAPPRGLSFGRIGSVQGLHNHHNSGGNDRRSNSRHRPSSRRESSLSSKSWSSSVSNLHNSKRKSIA